MYKVTISICSFYGNSNNNQPFGTVKSCELSKILSNCFLTQSIQHIALSMSFDNYIKMSWTRGKFVEGKCFI